MPPLSVMIKPASGLCNLRCKYCFYADEMSHREISSFGMMSVETMEQVIRKCLDFAEGSCHFGFQGGEPTLRGLDYFQMFVATVNRLNDKGTAITYSLQTNGVLVDDAWAEFFHQHRFLIGVSLDGNQSAHDLHRVGEGEQGTFNRVLKTVKLLERHRVEFNILTVVTAYTARHIQSIYRFFVKNGLVYQQYIPCLDPLNEPRGQHKYSLTPEMYGRFLIELFNCWYVDRMAGKFVYIRYFENLAAAMMGHRVESCGMMGRCGLQTVVEADGSVYPCDFYMLDEYKLGNFNLDTFIQINQRRNEVGFFEESAQGLDGCVKCKYSALCRGGCRRDRQGILLGEIEHNYFCRGLKEFFDYAVPILESML